MELAVGCEYYSVISLMDLAVATDATIIFIISLSVIVSLLDSAVAKDAIIILVVSLTVISWMRLLFRY